MHAMPPRERIDRVREGLERLRADWLLIPPSADFRWLTNAPARLSERLTALGIPRRGEPFAIVPRLDSTGLARACPWLRLEIWDEDEDAFDRLVRVMGLARGPAVLVGEGLRVPELLRLAAQARCRPARTLLAPLRAIKSADEIRLLETAAAHADRVIEQTADFLAPGRSEVEVAGFVFEQFAALGDSETWAIVASGPNSAIPHHHGSERRIEENDIVLLDLGAFHEGYGSDITRTFWIGEPPAEARHVYDIVDEARRTGQVASRDGADPEAVDQAARDVIERAGYGEAFTHRLGHGVGLDVHEPPYLVKGNHAPLAAGMVHSVEPGIYLPGRFGIRLEDTVVVESRGARALNRAPFDPLPPRLRG
jgi:Xaa-Pro aminopeptidase